MTTGAAALAARRQGEAIFAGAKRNDAQAVEKPGDGEMTGFISDANPGQNAAKTKPPASFSFRSISLRFAGAFLFSRSRENSLPCAKTRGVARNAG
jgi:hypothetical protein